MTLSIFATSNKTVANLSNHAFSNMTVASLSIHTTSNMTLANFVTALRKVIQEIILRWFVLKFEEYHNYIFNRVISFVRCAITFKLDKKIFF